MSVGEGQLKARTSGRTAGGKPVSSKAGDFESIATTPESVDADTSSTKATVPWWVRDASSYAFTCLTVLSFVTRYWRIWDPAQVVFDEVHFGKFASYYLRRQYYFDVHPPLAKMLIAAGGWLVGYDGGFLFDKIGLDYMSHGVPYIMLRGWVALFGAALPLLVYMIMAESGYSVAAALLAGLLVTFDNALVAHGRLIMLDNIMLFFILATVYAYVRFFKQRHRAFSAQWWAWLIGSGAMLGCTVSCKLVGLLTIPLIGSAVIYDLWRIIDIRRGTTMAQFAQHFAARVVGFIAVPFALYLGFFYIHFAVLTHTGPGDGYHTAQFQMQLIDSPMAKSSFNVHYGDEIAFRHRDTGVYLESSTARYPLRYEDKRVSSQGQQVTGAKKSSDAAYWRIIPASRQDDTFEGFMARLRHTDVVQLEHVVTGGLLRTHDVASPLMPTNMEFTVAAANDTAATPDTMWQIRIDGAIGNTTQLKTSASFVRVVSEQHGVAMWTHLKPLLPEWGGRHQEINGNKKPEEKSAVWTVAKIRGRVATPAEQEEMRRRVTPMSFLAKYAELQGLMLHHNSALTATHPFQSSPISWPLLTRGISFWTDNAQRRQIYLLGNPAGWWMADVALLLYAMLVPLLEFFRRRAVRVIDPVAERHLQRSTAFIVAAWALHYLPFFLMGRSLFLHHYLPSSIFAYMLLAAMFHFFNFDDYRRFSLRNWNGRARALLPSPIAALVFAVIAVVHIATFVFFAPLTYGSRSLPPDEINSRRWLSSYDLHFQK
ncbi:mannosyltransferase PMTI [Coemansia reversa NRRL 1564]|uniref:Dolichyl-phosphate-mannose--protein mannosyltransferase n=1 Tax=Coemansia reversa (strain ATCC 12441 / NRRL 1564) TaxID=763665 RepID=A0A2G5B8B6_COERN|nr:mannosyltransferase PMTI [Coemansia reversa NRRL 1564]|eukprot:PIA15241.1 mannosyltransferase PMTI [Coemansia reversa NRRL 1564]